MFICVEQTGFKNGFKKKGGRWNDVDTKNWMKFVFQFAFDLK